MESLESDIVPPSRPPIENLIASRKNILLFGRTGVGKSSFINYLLGRELA